MLCDGEVVSRLLRDRIFEAKLRIALPAELAELRALTQNERLHPEQLRSLAQASAADIVRFAMAHTDYYRERYARAGIREQDLSDPDAFRSLPVLERADVRDHFERIRSDEATPSNAQYAVTGGTTNEPLRVLRDRRASHRTLGWRLHRWWGVGPGANQALIWRDASSGFWKSLRHDALWWPTRSVRMDANHIDEKATAAFLDGWERIRPALLTGYVGAVIELAQLVQRSGRAIPPPKAVGVTAAPITPGQQEYVCKVFGAPVYDHYQCIESPMLAGECARHDGLHVFADARLVEILDDEGQPVPTGELGSVVITDFRNRVFPLIRYRLGDEARWKEGACPCGITFPMLEPVRGRITDMLRFPSGLIVSGDGILAIFDPWPDAVRQFQLRQERDYSLTLRCVRGSDANADRIMRKVVEEVRATARYEVPVRLELVDEIRHDRGKQRIVVSDVPGSPAARPPEAAER
jgi:phenylacetate-CoA ligase